MIRLKLDINCIMQKCVYKSRQFSFVMHFKVGHTMLYSCRASGVPYYCLPLFCEAQCEFRSSFRYTV